ncbi:MAG TPA: MgtC/SapB family protein [Candidatus Acidoferrales bacterium]|jgi:putative Mg2+ transporter-C (MgtC) family protein|nr:MgtC/SapB family protein [Candidatus Acidoferrales bacterium]
MTPAPLAQGFFLERLAVATALGLVIGLERQWRQRAAGLHTSTLVAVGAALFTAIPELVGSSDVMRVIAQVVTGVGFLAGGVILREGFSVRGLITAATLWATAAVGALAGAGLETQALAGAGVIVTVNLFGVPFANWIARIPRGRENLQTTYTLRVACSEAQRESVRSCILHQVHTTSLTLGSLATTQAANGGLAMTAEISKPGPDQNIGEQLRSALASVAGADAVNYDMAEQST